jgi:amino acid transporter
MLWIMPALTFAALDTNLKKVGSSITTAGETGPKLPELIGGLINVFLSVLGIIFIVLVVYSGYLWMTAGGEAMKVDKAKKLLGQAVIGLIIVVAAYAITAFVIDRIVGATTSSQKA